jgi:hypothetical protein
MTGQTQSEGLSPVVIVVLVGLIFVAMSAKKSPDKINPVPDDPPSQLTMEIRSALTESPPGTATAYGAFYDACAATLETDAAPIAKLRVRMERGKALLKLSAPEPFVQIVIRELGAFEDGAIDRQKYADAFRNLSVNCRKAER